MDTQKQEAPRLEQRPEGHGVWIVIAFLVVLVVGWMIYTDSSEIQKQHDLNTTANPIVTHIEEISTTEVSPPNDGPKLEKPSVQGWSLVALQNLPIPLSMKNDPFHIVNYEQWNDKKAIGVENSVQEQVWVIDVKIPIYDETGANLVVMIDSAKAHVQRKERGQDAQTFMQGAHVIWYGDSQDGKEGMRVDVDAPLAKIAQLETVSGDNEKKASTGLGFGGGNSSTKGMMLVDPNSENKEDWVTLRMYNAMQLDEPAYILRTKRLHWDEAENILYCPGDIIAESFSAANNHRINITGVGMVLELDKQRATVLEDVRVLIDGPVMENPIDSKPTPVLDETKEIKRTVITCDKNMVIDLKGHRRYDQIIFNENVEVRQTDMRLQSTVLTLQLNRPSDSKPRTFAWATAAELVTMTGVNGNEATCTLATFDNLNLQVKMYGRAAFAAEIRTDKANMRALLITITGVKKDGEIHWLPEAEGMMPSSAIFEEEDE